MGIQLPHPVISRRLTDPCFSGLSKVDVITGQTILVNGQGYEYAGTMREDSIVRHDETVWLKAKSQ